MSDEDVDSGDAGAKPPPPQGRVHVDPSADTPRTLKMDYFLEQTGVKSTAKLTALQKAWLGFCLTGILLTHSVCWAKFEHASLGD